MLLVISLLTFLIVEIAPGDAAQMYIDPDRGADPAYIQQVRENLGLDQPVYVRYAKWLGQTLSGDLGFSFRSRRAVSLEVGDRLPNTLLLGGAALFLSFVLAVPIGAISALKRHSLLDYAVTTLSLIGISVPIFWVALLLVQIFAIQLDFFPATGMRNVREQYRLASDSDVLHHLILRQSSRARRSPVCRAISVRPCSMYWADYIRTARVRFARAPRPDPHAFRMLDPEITRCDSIPSIVTARLSLRPSLLAGIGRSRRCGERRLSCHHGGDHAFRDLDLLGSLIADIAYVWADPRIRYD